MTGGDQVVGKGGEPRDHIYKGTVLAYTILDVIRKVTECVWKSESVCVCVCLSE